MSGVLSSLGCFVQTMDNIGKRIAEPVLPLWVERQPALRRWMGVVIHAHAGHSLRGPRTPIVHQIVAEQNLAGFRMKPWTTARITFENLDIETGIRLIRR